MADESKGLGDAVASLGTAITSPAKLAFAAYVILAALGVIKNVELWHFLLATGLFLLIQVFHDDYLRKVLNDAADLRAARASLARVTEWLKAQRHMPVRQLVEALNARLRGHYNYYGVIGNHRSLRACLYQVGRLLKKWLGRRSQKSRMTWERFSALLKRFPLEEPRITESRHRQMVLAEAS